MVIPVGVSILNGMSLDFNTLCFRTDVMTYVQNGRGGFWRLLAAGHIKYPQLANLPEYASCAYRQRKHL